MARIPVRFMQGGGNGVSSKPEEKKLNVISTGYGDVDADAFKAFISDPRNLEAIYDRYKGFDGSKIRGAVSSRLLEMANSFMKGDMKFDEDTINRYLSNNSSFASDGKTKKRFFTGNYSHKDQNTVNSLAARMMLDIINDNIKATSGKKAEVEKANEEAKKKAEAELEIYKPEEVLWDSRLNNGETILTGNREGNRKDIQAMIARDLKRLEDPDFVKGYTPESIEKAKIYYNDLAKYIADDRILSDEDYIRTFKINNPNIHRMLDWKKEEPQEQQQDPMAGLTEEQKELVQKQKAANDAAKALEIRQGIAEDEEKLKLERRDSDRKEWKKSYMSTPDYSGQYATYTITRDPSIPEDTSDMYKNWTSYMIDKLNDPNNNSSFRNTFTNEMNNYFLNGKLDFSKFSYKNDQTGEVLFTPSRIDQLQPFFNNIYSNNATGLSLMAYPNASGNVVVYDTRGDEPVIRTMSFAQAVRNNMFTAAKADEILDRMFDQTYPISNYDIEYDKNTGQFNVISPYFTQVQENAKKEAEKANGSVEQMRNGGVVKMQQGGNIDYSDLYELGTPMPVGDVDISMYYTDEQNKHYNEFKRRKEKDEKTFEQQRDYARVRGGDEKERIQHALKTKGGDIINNASDGLRLASSLFNLASLAASLSGFTPASTTIGVLGTSMNVLADWQDDSVSKAQAIKNAAINLGLDAVSLIPYAGIAANASKTAKAIKTASRLISSGAAAFAAAGLWQDSQIALNALQNKNVSEWNNQDVTAMLNIASMLMKGGATGKNARSRWNTSRDMKGGEQQYAVRVSSKNLSDRKNKIVLSENELKKLNNMRFEDGNPNGKPIGREEAVKAQKKFIMDNFDVEERDLDFNTPIKFSNESKGRLKGAKDYLGTSGRVYERNSFSPTNNPNSTGEFGLKTTGWASGLNKRPFIFFGYDPTDMSRHTRKDYVRRQVDISSNNNPNNTITQTNNRINHNSEIQTRQTQQNNSEQFNNQSRNPSDNKKLSVFNEFAAFKKGGRIKRVKLKNGGYVYKLQEGGGQWANGRPRGTYYDNGANYFDIWYNTTGKALEERLARMSELRKAGKLEEWNAARQGLMKGSRDIQSSYKGMNKQTGWGFNSTDYTPVADITRQHQDKFDKDFRSANENIWAYQGIHRRGNTGDNESSANKTDGINSVYTSMRTYGYTNDNQAEFEGDERFKRIQQLANENNLVYEPWKDIAEGKENWYVFSDRPNSNPLDLKPLNPDPLKPESPTPGKFDAEIHKPGVGAPVKTDPADLREKQPGTPGNSPIFGDLLSGAILAGTLATNKKAFYKLDTPLLSHPLYNAKTYDGYYEKDIANKEANKVRLAGRRFGAETADIDRYTANSLAGESMASELERRAGVESANKYDQTTERAINTFNTNATMSADTFNKNISSIVGTKNANKQLRGNYLTAQWEGAWKPFLNEIKGNWLQNQRERRLLDQERFMKTDYADYLKSSWDAAYKEAGITDPNNMNQQYLFENNRNIYDKYNRMNTNYYYANAPIYRQQNPLIMFRSGGKVTTRVTRKIDNDSFMKEFGKNDRESKKDFTRRFLNLSSGALTLHSASRKDRLELFNYLKNLK